MPATNKTKRTNSNAGKKKPSTAERNACWRKSKAAEVQDLIDELNTKRAYFNLPNVSLTMPKASLKGIKRKNYSPETELPPDELKQWKHIQLMKRKAAKQREARALKSALLKNFKEQLVVLDKRLNNS